MLCIVGFVVALSLFLLLPSSLPSSPFGVIVATNTAVVLVAPVAVALAPFAVALAVVSTTFLAVEVALVVDCCEPRRRRRTILSSSPFSLGEGSAKALVALALFVTLPLFVTLVFVIVTALIVVIAFADCCEPFVVYPHPSPRHRRRRTPPLPRHGLASAALSSPSLLVLFPLADALSTRPRSSLPRHILIGAGLIAALQYFPEVQ